MRTLALYSVALCFVGAQELAEVKTEPVLEKRAQKALDAANAKLTAVRAQYDKGEYQALPAGMEQVVALAELNLASLEAMGKHPSRNVKNYKLSEKRMRELLRRVETFANDVSFQDRDAVKKAQERINQLHEKLLEGALSKKP